MTDKDETTNEHINRLEEIKDEIEDLVNEAALIVRKEVGRSDIIYQRAEVYWIPHIKNSLESDTHYGTIESTIHDLKRREK